MSRGFPSLGQLQMAVFASIGAAITVSLVQREVDSTAWRAVAIAVTVLVWLAVVVATLRRPR